MRLQEIPFVGPLLAAGADDRVFDAFLVLGPVAILVITLLGRTMVSSAIAVAYTVGFLGYIAYKSLHA
jgi:hypothetical protein